MNWSSLVLRQAVMCRRAAAQGDESPSLLLLVYCNCNIPLYQCIAVVFALTQAFTHKLAKLLKARPVSNCKCKCCKNPTLYVHTACLKE